MVATGLASLLAELDYEVIGPVGNGRSAIEACLTETPDLALLDICMPDLNGLEAADQIFESFGIPTVIFSAFSSPEYVEGSRRNSIFGYLLKPVDEAQLRVGISLAWSRYLEQVNRENEIDTLRQRLEDRKIIEQAKWLIVEHKRISEPDAMRALQRQARNHRRPLIEVARSVIENVDLLSL